MRWPWRRRRTAGPGAAAEPPALAVEPGAWALAVEPGAWACVFPQEWTPGVGIRKATEPMGVFAGHGSAIRLTAVVYSFLLTNGTNLHALVHRRGARMMALRYANDWAIEERFNGALPDRRDAEVIDRTWRRMVEAAIEGKREHEAERDAE